jgi:hypothetical protein
MRAQTFSKLLLAAAMVLPLGEALACDTEARTSSGGVTCVILRNESSGEIMLSGAWDNYSCKQRSLSGNQNCSRSFDVEDEYGYLNNNSRVGLERGASYPLMWIDDAQDADWWYTAKWKRPLTIAGVSREIKVRVVVEAGVTYKSFAVDDLGWNTDRVGFADLWPGVIIDMRRQSGDIVLTVVDRPW